MACLQVWFDDESEVCTPVGTTFYGRYRVLSNEEIVASKVLLAIASSVFEREFYGPIAEKDPVELSDIEPGVFKKMLQFIYSHQVDIVSIEEASDLIKVAHKYSIYDLIKVCVAYYMGKLCREDMKGLCHILNVSVLYDLEIKAIVIQRLQQSTNLLLKSEDFLDLSVDAVTCILQRGQHNVNSEKELIDAAVLWATARYEEQDTSLSGKSVRVILEETGVFKHLRFLTLTDTELGELESAQILSEKETKDIKGAIYSGNDLPLPASICCISQPRNFTPFLTYKKAEEFRRTSRYIVEIIPPTTINETFEVMTTGSINLTDVTVSSQITNTTSEVYNFIYEEELQVKVIKLKKSPPLPSVQRNTGNSRFGLNNSPFGSNNAGIEYQYTDNPTDIIATGYFIGKVKYNDLITVPLLSKVGVRGSHGLTNGDRFVMYVTFHKKGKYPSYQASTSTGTSYGIMKSLLCNGHGHVIKISYETGTCNPIFLTN
ncbi:uncharacterized protein [Periplaneta americana]|uniref:uncharacterized protein n=1 Tax=Periplaneta americana TaxID=6978 RepID=UPI0037E8D6B5